MEDIGGIWYEIDFDVKKRFQKFLFPDGVLYDGEDFRTIKTALCIEKKWQEDFQKSTMASAAWIAGFLPILLGVISIILPEAQSSLGFGWGLIATFWGALFIATPEFTKPRIGS